MSLILKSISLNTNGNPACGSLHCRKNHNTPIPATAHLTNGTISLTSVFAVASLVNNINIYAEIENTGDTIINATIIAKETKPRALGDIAFPGTTFQPFTTTSITTTINAGTLNSYQDKTVALELKWKWVYKLSGFASETELATVSHRIYMLHARPLPPWETARQPYSLYEANYVWTDLLDICCAACDAIVATLGHWPLTDQEHLEAFTDALNGDRVFRYDKNFGACAYTMMQGVNRIVKLQKYIEHHNSKYYCVLNCTDCATILQTLSLACGVITRGVRITEATRPYRSAFVTNPIAAIGYDNVWEIPFRSTGFLYHEMATLNPVRDRTTEIYDACLHFDGGPTPSAMRPAVKIHTLPKDVPFAETVAVNVNVPTAIPYTHNFYRERLVAHGANCRIEPDVITVVSISPSLSLENSLYLDESEYLRPIMRSFGLEENPLSARVTNENMDSPDFETHLPLLGNSLPLEDYGRYRVYTVLWDNLEYRVEITFALDENEAFSIAMNMLMGIARSGMRREEGEELSFTIEGEMIVRVKNNIVIMAASTGEPDKARFRAFVKQLCESL